MRVRKSERESGLVMLCNPFDCQTHLEVQMFINVREDHLLTDIGLFKASRIQPNKYRLCVLEMIYGFYESPNTQN